MKRIYKQKEIRPFYRNSQLFLQYLKSDIIGSEQAPDPLFVPEGLTVYHYETDPDALVYDKTTVPQLVHYYYPGKQKVSTNETVVPIYFTDWYQREYYFNDTSLRFNIRLEIDGNVKYINSVKAGDYNLSLGVLDVGEHHFSIEIEDVKHRLKSHRLFNLIWIVDDSNDITPAQTHQLTETEMTSYNITLGLDDTATAEQMTNNKTGVTSLLSDLHNQGYRKVIFPANSVIRVNSSGDDGSEDAMKNCIIIPTDMTVDLNGSTIKLHPYDDREYGDRGGVYNYMVVFEDCIDSHMINGTMEGDYFERKELIWPELDDEGNTSNALGGGNGEHCSCISMNGGKYNTLDNITIKQVTGYNLQCEKTYQHMETVNMSYHFGENKGCWLNGNNTDIIDGVETTVQEERCTSDYIDISSLVPYGGFSCGKWLTDYPSGSFYEILLSFYDEDKNFIESFIAYQARNIEIPENSRYLRATFNGKWQDLANDGDYNGEPDFFLLSPVYSEYNEWNNVTFIDNATCCNPNRFKHLRIYNCQFIRCGEYITPLVIDAEDGGATMQDLFVENCEIVEPGTVGDFASVAGLNTLFQNNKNMDFGIREELVAATIRNNVTRSDHRNASNELSTGWRTRHTIRCYNNDYQYKHLHYAYGSGHESQMKLKGCNNMQGFDGRSDGGTGKGWLLLDECSHVPLSCNICYNKCNIYLDDTDAGNNCTNKSRYRECNITCESTSTTTYNIRPYNYGDYVDDIGEWINCNFNVNNSTIEFTNFQLENDFLRGYFYGCTFDSNILLTLQYANEMGDIQFNNCTFNRDLTIDLRQTRVQFNNCTFNGNITYRNNGQANSSFN